MRLCVLVLLAACSTSSGRSKKDAGGAGDGGVSDVGGLADVGGGTDGAADGADAADAADSADTADATDGNTADVGGGEVGDVGETTGDVEAPAGVCGEMVPDGLPVGSTCTDHSECGTGFCYDEELWNEDGVPRRRFCTAACAGCTVVSNCNEWPKAAGVFDNKCYPLTSKFINTHKLAASSLCLAGCNNDGDCQNLGEFSRCALLSFGDDCNYGATKVCQPESFVGAEACQ